MQTGQGIWLIAAADHWNSLPQIPLREPTRHERLEAETELFGFAVSGHPLELFEDIAWDTYCPVNRLGESRRRNGRACGLVVEQRTHHQITGEPMKFLTLADWTGMVETELFAQTYKNYGLATVRYPVLEVRRRSNHSRMVVGFPCACCGRANRACAKWPEQNNSPLGRAADFICTTH